MAAEQAKALRLNFIVAGRDPAALAQLAAQLDVARCPFLLDRSTTIAETLSGVTVLHNGAAPFLHKAKRLMRPPRGGCRF